nr:hypothetical protein [Kofleriaceae bacterium]
MLGACGAAAPQIAATPAAGSGDGSGSARSAGALATDPDLNPPRSPRLVDVDWATVKVPDEAAALALWKTIAPTGDDWERKLDEVPSQSPAARQLALALLHGGNFACAAAPQHTHNCAAIPADAAAPASTAGLDDPCLRRLLALWALGEVDPADVPALHPTLRALAALPPPESELVAAAIETVPEADQDERLAMMGLAQRAGQLDVVDKELAQLDVPHLMAAVDQLHTPAALDMLSAQDNRDVFLHAISDEHMPTRGRVAAIIEVATADPDLAADARTALVGATASPDCEVAAQAARSLAEHDDTKYEPKRPRGTRTPAQMQRALCVLASYEARQGADEPSLWPSYLPAHGVERVTISYDPLSDTDLDGDGDPHTTHQFAVEARKDAVLPEIADLVKAMRSCTTDATSVTCTSDQHRFKFLLAHSDGELVVRQLAVAENPPCQDADVSP